MISGEILRQLVPQSDPRDDFPIPERLRELPADDPSRRIGIWSAYLRHRLTSELTETGSLSRLVQSSGYVGTGIFKMPFDTETDDYSGFERHQGYQFGAMLFRADFEEKAVGSFVDSLALDFDRYRAPVMQTLAEFRDHSHSPDGYVAATYDKAGECFGITAGHVVKNYRRGQRVPVECSDCDDEAKLRKLAPGLLDAAIVRFPCGGPCAGITNATRPAIEGEQVEAHYGDSGKENQCTVMSALQTPAQIKSAAMPQHFLIDIHGHPGDSGSLISSEYQRMVSRDLLGIYLGQTDCENIYGGTVTYGYALDLRQAAELMGVDPNQLQGVYND